MVLFYDKKETCHTTNLSSIFLHSSTRLLRELRGLDSDRREQLYDSHSFTEWQYNYKHTSRQKTKLTCALHKTISSPVRTFISGSDTDSDKTALQADKTYPHIKCKYFINITTNFFLVINLLTCTSTG